MRGSFFTELRRRNVYKVAVAYAVVGWLLVQIATQVFPFFEIPNWAVRLVVLAIIIGFPIALVIAWAFELTPEGLKRTEEGVPQPPRERRYGWVYVIVVATAISIALFFLGRFTAPDKRRDTADRHEKSIAVLPFENLSEDKANAFFASGIQDEILTALAKISGLKVISRTSTARYQSSPQNLPEIARALAVTHILEGTVQKSGDRVHVNVQLIRAETDAHIWAQSYDRSLADIFAVEAEVARTVATELRATLSPEEKGRIESKPTENNDAYVLYLRALEYANRPTDLLEDMQKAIDLYGKAIDLDPKFALARAHLSGILAHIYLTYQPTDAIAARARAEADESLRLQPDLGEAHHARGMCLYWTQKDYAAALQELEIAARLLPNEASIEADMAYIHRRQGHWREALAGLERALARAPQDAVTAHEYFLMFCNVRDWSAASGPARRAVAIAPDLPTIRVGVSYLDVWSKGDVTSLRAALDAVPPGVDPDGQITGLRYDAAMLARDFDGADRAVANCARETILPLFGGIPTPKTYLRGCIALARGNPEQAKPFFERALANFEAEAQALPMDPYRHAQLGLLYAYLGRARDALREVHRAIELEPESRDAMSGTSHNAFLALIYARTGEPQRAVEIIERLLTIPAEVAPGFEANMTVSELRLRWQWDPLRKDPGFQKILDGPEPKTMYK